MTIKINEYDVLKSAQYAGKLYARHLGVCVEDPPMRHWVPTRSVLLSVSFAAILLFQQTAPSAVQIDKFREDLQKGEAALNQRNYEAAVTAYKNSIRDARGMTGENFEAANAQANLGLSRAYLGLGAFKNAIESCDEALKHTGGNAMLEGMVRNQRGLAIVAAVSKPGDPALENAVTEFRKVLSITDQDPMISYNLGVTLLKLNRDTEGIHELQMYVARAGRTPQADIARKMIDEPRRARENFAPDFSFTTLNGEFVTLEDLRGKVVLVDFWGTWCPPCRESTPSLVKYSKKHSSETFVIVGIAVNEPNEQGWRDYIEKNKMVWPQYLDSMHKISNLFKVTAFPTYITLDADGVIRDRRTGWTPDTMSFLDEQVKRAEKARAKSGPPTLKAAPERIATTEPQPTTTTTATPRTVSPLPNPVATTSVVTAAPVTPAVTTSSAPLPVDNAIPPVGFAVRGHVTRLPGASAIVRANLIQPGQVGVPPVITTAVVSPDGSFEFFNVRPGNYNVTVSAPVPFQPIVVSNSDVSGIEFSVPPTRTVAGRVVMDGVGAAPQRLLFTVIYTNGTVTMNSTVQPDGTFNVLLPEGEHRIALNAVGYYVRSMSHGFADLLKDPLTLSNTDTAQLVVALTPNPSSVGIPPAGVPGPRGAGPGPGTAPVIGNRCAQPGPSTDPVPISMVQGQYTDQARQQRIQGIVSLQGVVRTDGTVGNIQVTRSLDPGLDQAAIEAIKQWRFRPATRNGVPVDVPMSFQMTFSLQ